jgi:hypothetical protein
VVDKVLHIPAAVVLQDNQEVQAVEETQTRQVLLQEDQVLNHHNQAIVVHTDLEIQEALVIQEILG